MSAAAALALTVAHAQVALMADDGRSVAVTVHAPARGCRNCTLVIFSHGARATPQRYGALLDAWAARGLVVAAPLHTDSEEYPEPGRYPDSTATRLSDWRAVDAGIAGKLPRGVSLSGRVIAAGHSYGALIAEIVGGAQTEGAAPRRGWRLPAAVIALSPPGARAGFVTAQGFAAIARPTLVVSGTTDVLPGFIDRWEQHLDSYRALRPGLGYALVFAGMDHYFNGAFGRPRPEGSLAAPQVARLNTIVIDFIRGAQARRLPTRPQWTGQSDAMLQAHAR